MTGFSIKVIKRREHPPLMLVYCFNKGPQVECRGRESIKIACFMMEVNLFLQYVLRTLLNLNRTSCLLQCCGTGAKALEACTKPSLGMLQEVHFAHPPRLGERSRQPLPWLPHKPGLPLVLHPLRGGREVPSALVDHFSPLKEEE